MWALVPPDRTIRLKPLSSRSFSHFKVKSSKFRNQKGFRAFPHSAEPVPLCDYTLEIMLQSGLITRREYDGTVSDIHQSANCGHLQFYPLPKSDLLTKYYSSNIFYDANQLAPDIYHN